MLTICDQCLYLWDCCRADTHPVKCEKYKYFLEPLNSAIKRVDKAQAQTIEPSKVKQ